MTTAAVNGIEIFYEERGGPGEPAVLLIMGLGAQMTVWPDEFIDDLVARGFRVVWFDNRDVGLSTKLTGTARPNEVLSAVLAGEPVPDVPYTLSDMAADGIGLLDQLGVERAHIAGVSMGGMIVQTMAIEFPERIASLTSVMSSTGDPRSGAATPEAREALLAPPPLDREGYIEASTRAEVWASKRYVDHDAMRARAAADYDRSFYPQGALRQLAAIYASGDRTERLRALDVSTLVIHGRDDTLITPSGGEATAAAITGSKYLLLADMGHDLPPPLWPVLAEAIGGHVRVSEAA